MKTEDVVFEERAGDVSTRSCRTAHWGTVTVTAWDPPTRVVFDWKPNDEDHPHTQVEVVFEPLEAGGSLVTLEHRGWEALGAELGAEGRESYAEGWPLVFDRCFGGAAA